jgi:hypothetical protein
MSAAYSRISDIYNNFVWVQEIIDKFVLQIICLRRSIYKSLTLTAGLNILAALKIVLNPIP